MTTSNPPRGYMNSLSRPPPCGTTGGQLSDPDSGCFSSSGNDTWFDQRGLLTMDSSPLSSSGSSMMSQMRDRANGDMSQQQQMSQIMSQQTHQPQNMAPNMAPNMARNMAPNMAPNMATVAANNTRLLAHTLENRKRVLQTLIREKADTLV